MAKRNGLQHSNECQFYITLRERLTSFDNKYVAFGRVISGIRLLKHIEKEGISEDNVCTIVGCGLYQFLVNLPSYDEFVLQYENIRSQNKENKQKLKDQSYS